MSMVAASSESERLTTGQPDPPLLRQTRVRCRRRRRHRVPDLRRPLGHAWGRRQGLPVAPGIVAAYLEVAAQVGILGATVSLLMIAGEFDLSVGSMIGAAGPAARPADRPVRRSTDDRHHPHVRLRDPRRPVQRLAADQDRPADLPRHPGHAVHPPGSGHRPHPRDHRPDDRQRPQGQDRRRPARPSCSPRRSRSRGPTSRSSLLWWIVSVVVATWVLLRTRFGNWIFAVGGSKQAARYVGVPVAPGQDHPVHRDRLLGDAARLHPGPELRDRRRAAWRRTRSSRRSSPPWSVARSSPAATARPSAPPSARSSWASPSSGINFVRDQLRLVPGRARCHAPDGRGCQHRPPASSLGEPLMSMPPVPHDDAPITLTEGPPRRSPPTATRPGDPRRAGRQPAADPRGARHLEVLRPGHRPRARVARLSGPARSTACSATTAPASRP